MLKTIRWPRWMFSTVKWNQKRTRGLQVSGRTYKSYLIVSFRRCHFTVSCFSLVFRDEIHPSKISYDETVKHQELCRFHASAHRFQRMRQSISGLAWPFRNAPVASSPLSPRFPSFPRCHCRRNLKKHSVRIDKRASCKYVNNDLAIKVGRRETDVYDFLSFLKGKCRHHAMSMANGERGGEEKVAGSRSNMAENTRKLAINSIKLLCQFPVLRSIIRT